MKALCVKSYTELQQLVAQQVPTVEAKLVEREVTDKVENGLQKLVPYVVFYSMDISAGKLKFIQYLRPAAPVAEGEEAAPRFTSIGFGQPISTPEEIRSQETIVGEDGETAYAMSLSDMLDTCVVSGMADVLTMIGLDVKAVFGPVIDANDLAFFNCDAPGDENRVTTGIAIPVALTEEQFELVRTTAQLNPTFVDQLDTLGINIDRIVEEMDITPTIQNVIAELVGKYNLEAFSAMMFNYIARKELAKMLKDVSYNDIVALVHSKRAAMQQIAQETIAEQQAAAAAEGNAVVDSADLSTASDAEVQAAVATTTDAPAEEVAVETVAQETEQPQG